MWKGIHFVKLPHWLMQFSKESYRKLVKCPFLIVKMYAIKSFCTHALPLHINCKIPIQLSYRERESMYTILCFV